MPLSGLVTGIDHVGVCVASMDEASGLWAGLLGQVVAHRECVDVQRTEAAFFDFQPGQATVELVAPMAGNAGLERFLSKRGNGLHHLAFAVTDLRLALTRLREAGVALIDKEPRQGARGHLVAFLHPSAMDGTLVELVQHQGTLQRGEGR
jgi:methylmalonyl-CoA/ethylmalonyl-CoA epimerase